MKYLFIILLSINAQAGIIRPAPSPTPLTTPQAQSVAARQIIYGANRILTTDGQAALSLGEIVWQNTNGLSAQQVFQALDNVSPGDSCDAHQKFTALATFLNSIVAGTVPSEPTSVLECQGIGYCGACAVVIGGACPSPSPVPSTCPSPSPSASP